MRLGPEQRDVFNQARPYIEAFGSSPLPEFFPGSAIAGFNPTEQAAQQYYTGVAAPTTAGMAGQAASTQQQLMDPNFMLNPNQYVHAAADATTQRTTDNLMRNILPGIRSGAAASGGQYTGGATRAGIAEGNAIGQTGDAISQAIADMYFKNYQTGLGTMAQQVNQNPALMRSMTMPGDILGAVGAQQRGMEQAQLDEEVNRFYLGQPGQLEQGRAQQLLQMIGMMPGGTGVSTVTGAQPQSNPFAQILGMGSSIAGMMGSLGPLGMAMK